MAKNEAASRETNEEVERAHEVDPPGRPMDTYAAVIPSMGRTAADAADQLFG